MKICFKLKKTKHNNFFNTFFNTLFLNLLQYFLISTNSFFVHSNNINNYLNVFTSAELINVVNAVGGVVPPVLADADFEPSVPHEKFTV